MTGRVLIVDAVPTNRIVLRVKLASAFYQVSQAESGAAALDMVLRERPDVILASADLPDLDPGRLCAQLRALPDVGRTPLVVVQSEEDAVARRSALRAGADDVLACPIEDVLLLARLRALLRARDAEAELELREDTRRALGLAEEPAPFSGNAHIVLVDAGHDHRVSEIALLLERRLSDRIEVMEPKAALSLSAERADAFVILEARRSPGEGLALLSQLRANTATRHASLIYVAAPGHRREAAGALDIGANDLLVAGFECEELALRLQRQIARKRREDRLRANMRDGLRAAVTDPLTGLYNRRYALPHLARFADRAKRSGRPYALMLVDVDHFKTVNDTYGHAAGDAVLVALAARLRDGLRAPDLLARIGGEEFLLAMPDMPRNRASAVAETLCHAVSNKPMPLADGRAVSVSVSIGISIGDPSGQAAPQDLLQRADRALYAAKDSGRNTVVLADTITPLHFPERRRLITLEEQSDDEVCAAART